MNRRQAFLAAPLLAAAVAAAGCGGSSSPTTQATSSVQPATGGASVAPGAGFGPAAFGVTAAISGNSIEVQNPQTGQTTVTWTSTTRFSDTSKATLSAVRVGSCVTVIGPATSSSAALTATNVSIIAAVNGSCATRRTGPGGGAGGFTRPSGAPTPRFSFSRTPTAPQSSVFGQVTVVFAGGFTVKGFMRKLGAGTPPTPAPSASPVTASIAVTVAGATSYTTTTSATATALKVGLCVTAIGSASQTGAVTARSISISPPVNGSCSGGFGRRLGFAGGVGG